MGRLERGVIDEYLEIWFPKEISVTVRTLGITLQNITTYGVLIFTMNRGSSDFCDVCTFIATIVRN